MAEDPVCPDAPSVDANDLGIKDCSSARKSLSNRGDDVGAGNNVRQLSDYSAKDGPF